MPDVRVALGRLEARFDHPRPDWMRLGCDFQSRYGRPEGHVPPCADRRPQRCPNRHRKRPRCRSVELVQEHLDTLQFQLASAECLRDDWPP